MKKTCQIIFLTLVPLVLAGLGVMTLFFAQTQPREFNVYEKRRLAEKPVLTAASVCDGSYLKDTESYLFDHLHSRSYFLRSNIALQKMTGCISVNGTIEVNGILLPDNGIYDRGADNFTENADIISQQLAAVRDVTEENGGTFLYVLIPTQRNIFEVSYPDYLNSDHDRTEDTLSALLPTLENQQIDTMFLKDTILKSTEPLTALYSTVDHHFTLKGANLCARAIIDHLTTPICAEMLRKPLSRQTVPN